MGKRNLLLLSNGTMPGLGFLEHAQVQITSLLKSKNVSKVLFVPYALHDKDSYESKARKAFAGFGFELESIHRSTSPVETVCQAEAIFIGGGNTFRLLKALCDYQLIAPIREKVLQEGIPYIGASAGTNVATVNICTTNDMPIVFPPTFKALNLVPFNINPHYIEPDVNSNHMGETREERITQYFEEEESYPVVGLREGSYLAVEGDKATIHGAPQLNKLFTKDNKPQLCADGMDLSFLLKNIKK